MFSFKCLHTKAELVHKEDDSDVQVWSQTYDVTRIRDLA